MKEVFLLKNRQLRKRIQNSFQEHQIEEIATTSGFKTRNSGKIKPKDFLWLSCFSSHNLCKSSLEELCASLHINRDISISSQGLDQRLNGSSSEFLKNIFLALCKNQYRYIEKALR